MRRHIRHRVTTSRNVESDETTSTDRQLWRVEILRQDLRVILHAVLLGVNHTLGDAPPALPIERDRRFIAEGCPQLDLSITRIPQQSFADCEKLAADSPPPLGRIHEQMHELVAIGGRVSDGRTRLLCTHRHVSRIARRRRAR